MKLTKWIDGTVKPTLIGYYERDYGGSPQEPDYWDGKEWKYSEDDVRCLNQKRTWRGLAEDPNKEQSK